MAEEDVTDAGSQPAEANEEAPDTGSVNADAQVTDRPVQNIIGEFNRKIGKIQERFEQARQEDSRKMDAILQYLASASQTQTRQVDPTQGNRALSKEELWALAQQGNRQAFEEYQRQIAAEQYQQQSQVDRKQTMVQNQLQALVNKYPVLRDSANPLTQHAHQAYQLLVNNGYPANQETLLEAAKTAIADRPDLVSEIYNQGSQARESQRQNASQRAQAGVTGATSRRADPQAQQRQVKVTDASVDLAKRMGVKDPKGAKERFLKRQESGQSSFGSVAAFIPESDI